MGRARIIAVIFTFFGLGGCVQVPSFDGPAGVPVSAVVARLKCEIRRVAWLKSEDPRYEFLKHWAAKVHLTVAVDDAVGLNPGATITEPLHNAYAVAAGPTTLAGTTIASVPQSFGVGLGGGLNSEVVRQEDLEFFLSFAELSDDSRTSAYEFNECARPNGILLQSDLKMEELFDSALAPVRDRVLTIGAHPPLTQTVPAISSKEANNFRQSLKSGQVQYTASLPKSLGNVEPADRLDAKNEIENHEKHVSSVVDNIIKPLSEVATSSLSSFCAGKITDFKNKAMVSASLVYADELAVEQAKTTTNLTAALKGARLASKTIDENANDVINILRNCPNSQEAQSKASQKLYDPLDLIGQTVNFYITISGSVTPTWKLVRAAAPLAPTFANANGKFTDTLILSFGRPDTSNGTLVASTAMNQQILSGLIAQALQTGPGFR